MNIFLRITKHDKNKVAVQATDQNEDSGLTQFMLVDLQSFQ
jgi:hypothetical protein